MKPRLNLKLFAKFFWGLADEKEKKKIFESKDSDEMLKKHWDESGSRSLNAEDKERILEQVQSRTKGKLLRMHGMWRVAAVIVLLVAIGGAIEFFVQPTQNITYIEKSNPSGARSQIVLPDNSVVWLNAQSKIIYPETFKELDRRVVELQGEAYFEVTHNKMQPFTVKTKRFDVQVLGTSFNVKSYEQNNEYMTTLVSGSVKLSDKKDTREEILKPGEMGVFHANRKAFEIRENVDVKRILAWKDGKMIFDNASFIKLTRELERWYGVNIILDPALKGKHRYTMTITDENLREVCNLIKETTPVKYTIQDNKVIFSRSK